MHLSSQAILKLIHSTNAFAVWNRQQGPVFWYALGVPGPFYINTEWIVGKKLSAKLLEQMTALLAATQDPAERANQVQSLVMAAYQGNEVYQNIIETMAATARQQFSGIDYTFLSGGERRDWLFSIPLAQKLGLKHVFLFKNKTLFCADALAAGESGLHIADLINNAASYFDAWLPILTQAQLTCRGTICVIARGAGLQKLEAAGIEVAPLQKIDLGFFEQSAQAGLIDQETLKEISCHFASPVRWAETYLMGRPEVFAAPPVDAKAPERMRSFFAKDPWQLREKYPAVFGRFQQEAPTGSDGR